MNTQPWEFTVLTGEALEDVRRSNVERLNSGAPPNPEHVVTSWPKESIYRRRQVDLAKQLFQLMDISREDKEKRARWLERGFRYFDAPAAIIVFTDRCLSESGPLLDIGAVIQTICLAALHFGLGTCIEDQGTMYPEALRKHSHIPESKRIIAAVAIGYPDWDFPANKLESEREPIRNVTTWLGFD
jgi:nitroreductase